MSEAFRVCLRKNRAQTGVAVHTETQPIPSMGEDGKPDGGIQYQGIVHVLWDDPQLASPAPSFHSPTDLVHMGILNDPDLDQEEEEEKGESESEESGEAEESEEGEEGDAQPESQA